MNIAQKVKCFFGCHEATGGNWHWGWSADVHRMHSHCRHCGKGFRETKAQFFKTMNKYKDSE